MIPAGACGFSSVYLLPASCAKDSNLSHASLTPQVINVPFGVTYEKIGTIQRRLAWPLHKDDTLSRSGRPTGLNIYFLSHSSPFDNRLPLMSLTSYEA